MEARPNLVVENILSTWKSKRFAASSGDRRSKPTKRPMRIRTFKSLEGVWTSNLDPTRFKEATTTTEAGFNQSEAADERSKLVEKRIRELARFGPTYARDTDPYETLKDSAWKHIVFEKDGKNGIESSYVRVIKEMEKEIEKCYDATNFEKKLKRGVEFRMMMARDGCFFLQLALVILGGWRHLGYPSNHLNFGENNCSASLIPDMFFVGNQIPYILINALMKQPFFQGVIKEGVEKRTWKRPPMEDMAKLALYVTVVQPHLEKEKKPDSGEETPSDVLQTLHNMILRSGSDIDDPTYHEMREFKDLEANDEGKVIKIHSAGELQKRGIQVVRGEPGIPNIRFENWGYSAFLYVPPFIIDAHTEELLTSLANYELALEESEREFTAYLRFMRDLSRNYKDFKILEKKGIILVKDDRLKATMVRILDSIVSRHNSNYTLNFCQIRRSIKDYGGPPWRLISVCLGILAVVQTIFTILAYCIPRG